MGKVKRLHLVSVIILVMFLLFALGSKRLGSTITEREDLGDGVVRETHVGACFDDGEPLMHANPRVVESKRDDKGLRQGEYLSYHRDKTGHFTGTYETGVRHGWFYYYSESNPPDDLTGKLYQKRYYEYGRCLESERFFEQSSFQTSTFSSQSQSFVYLDNNWPWFIYEMEQGDISEELLISFIIEVEKNIAQASPSDQEQFIDAYNDAVEEIGQVEEFNSVYEEYIYIASFEDESSGRRLGLRLAIFDWYHGKGTSVYQILEEDYPDFLQELLDKNLSRSHIEGFVNELESRLEDKGPLDLEDPLYVFSLEDRIEEAVNEIDGYNTVKRALRDLLFDLYHEGDPLLQSILQSHFLTSFPDVSPDHPFFDEIEKLVDEGIIEGFPDGTFKPGRAVTRQAFAAFMFRALELEDPGVTEATFTDVSSGHPFFAEIEACVEAGIIEGFDDGTFKPGRNVTRQAAAAFLFRGFALDDPGVTQATFTDVSTGHPFFTEIEAGAAAGIIEGFPDGTFKPGRDVTRQAAAAFLYRALGLE